jgi:hypothetical protein
MKLFNRVCSIKRKKSRRSKDLLRIRRLRSLRLRLKKGLSLKITLIVSRKKKAKY